MDLDIILLKLDPKFIIHIFHLCLVLIEHIDTGVTKIEDDKPSSEYNYFGNLFHGNELFIARKA